MHRPTDPTPLHIAAVAEMPLGSAFAHAINTFKTAGGFARLGHRVTVMCLPPVDSDIAGALAVYGEPNLEVRPIAPDRSGSDDEASIAFSRRAAALAAKLGCDRIYGRNFYIAFEGPRLGLPTAIETHAHIGDARPLLDAVFAATTDRRHPLHAIITIAPVLRDHYIARGADPDRVHLVPDAADPALFAPNARPHHGAKRARPSAVYAGHLYDHKGIPTILQAATIAPEIDWVLLGGTPEDVARVRALAADLNNVHVRGRVPHIDVPAHLWNADVLLLPPSANHPSAQWTSPVKLAEYLWSDRPIVASRITGLENWIAEPAVAWFTPDDAADMVHRVRAVLAESDADAAARRAARARAASRFTYANRAARILDALPSPAATHRNAAALG